MAAVKIAEQPTLDSLIYNTLSQPPFEWVFVVLSEILTCSTCFSSTFKQPKQFAKVFGQKQQMYHRLGVVPKVLEISKFAHNEIASHLPCPGGSRNFDQNRLMISLGCCGAEAPKKNWEISRDNLDLFSWWCFTDYTMGFITIIHHHLVEYVFGTLSRHRTSKSKARNGNVWRNKSMKKGSRDIYH